MNSLKTEIQKAHNRVHFPKVANRKQAIQHIKSNISKNIQKK